MSTRVRDLSAAEMNALRTARLVALHRSPYLATALLATRPVAAEGLGTFAVDRHWRLYLDPETLADWGPQQAGGVLIHEVGHLVRGHAERADALGDRDHLLWNLACDAAINDDLIAAGIELPEGVVTPESIDLPARGVEEQYYALLRARQTDPPPDMSETHPLAADDSAGETGKAEDHSDSGCGSGAGDPVAEWELSADDAQAPGLSQAEADFTRRQVAEAVRDQASGEGRGSVPGGWQRWATAQLAPPTVAWQAKLRAAVRRAVAWRAGNGEWSYRRPSRRRVPGILTPGRRRPVITVAVVLDTSASMGETRLHAALSEVQGVIRASGATVKVISCDAAVAATTSTRAASQVSLAGGGGTDLRVGIQSAMAATPRPDVLIVLTDGGTPWPKERIGARLVIGLIGEAWTEGIPEWAEVVRIPVPVE